MLKAKSKATPKKAKAKSIAKPKTTVRAKAKGKGLSLSELFELKKQQEAQRDTSDPHTHEAPPHELHDKANLQDKAKGESKMVRGPGPGNRHH
jgi:hypothetical protein